jgi:hypothetical protein
VSRNGGAFVERRGFLGLGAEDAAEGGVDVRGVGRERAVEPGERVGAVEVHAARDRGASNEVVGDEVCLQAVLHLDAVFERAQEGVGVGELGALALGDEAAVGEAAQ